MPSQAWAGLGAGAARVALELFDHLEGEMGVVRVVDQGPGGEAEAAPPAPADARRHLGRVEAVEIERQVLSHRHVVGGEKHHRLLAEGGGGRSGSR